LLATFKLTDLSVARFSLSLKGKFDTKTMIQNFSVLQIPLYSGAVAALVGLITFTLRWNLWDGPMPGYQILLFPGKLSLTYIWHPLFTEEIDLLPKLGLQLLGQFFFVSVMVWILVSISRKIFKRN